ncbi:SIR2 family protein [Stieleria sp. TO1_6]|uniref:SIR2 family anti-phage-associated protein n=1 Tax=Stieleria tagensis TaxID=2956795 RepID=UPI00209A82BF|nr:SIR2 family anti-phage-associated protein [Stieleria tagensis]MCO8123316.1 SIR2 family protein [Stieleria tagensis]
MVKKKAPAPAVDPDDDSGASETEVIAFRGDSKLDEEALRAHLAAVLRLEHIGVLLGAGASVGVGGMTINTLWEEFTTEFNDSFETLKEHSFVEDDEIPNLEEVMDDLQIAVLDATRREAVEKEDLVAAQLDLRRAVVSASVLQQGYWEDPLKVRDIPPQLQDHCQLLQKIRGARQPGQAAPWIFTPNYDLAIEWAAEAVGLEVMNGFRGLHNRTFSPHAFDLGLRNTLARGEARFGCYEVYLAKLHGSLTWIASDDDCVVEKSGETLWPKIREFRDSGEDDFGQEMVFPSAAKYMQTVGFVLGELFRRFTEFLNRPQTALIVNGYSFCDDHLNRIILSALQNPTLSLVVYAPAAVIGEDGPEVGPEYGSLQRLVALKSPQVTIVGGGPRAFFDKLVADLPDPAIFDERSAEITKMIREIKGGKNA